MIIRATNGKLLLTTFTTCREAYYDEDANMAVHVDEHGNISYSFWMTVTYPHFMEVKV